MNASAPLTLVQLIPDLPRLAAWAAATRQQALQVDRGYALHAATQAVLGALAPRPFALRQREHPAHGEPRDELIGYVAAAPDELRSATDLPPRDAEAAAAVGLHTLRARAMPAEWPAGQRLSFEVRVAPLVRSRTARAGAIVEMDAAYHASLAGDRPGDREAAYGAWLARELQRNGAAALDGWTMLRFQLTPIARRSQARDGIGGRDLAQGLVPDLTARGALTLNDPAAFNALLARGLGRHRSFGYGCLLLAPPGVLYRGGGAA